MEKQRTKVQHKAISKEQHSEAHSTERLEHIECTRFDALKRPGHHGNSDVCVPKCSAALLVVALHDGRSFQQAVILR